MPAFAPEQKQRLWQRAGSRTEVRQLHRARLPFSRAAGCRGYDPIPDPEGLILRLLWEVKHTPWLALPPSSMR